MSVDPKNRRSQMLPPKIAKFVTLSEGNDFITYRDAERFPQFENETFQRPSEGSFSNPKGNRESEHECALVN